MNLPDEDHVMRHVGHKNLERDGNGHHTGRFLPGAVTLRDCENGLSVNWLEHFSNTMDANIIASIKTFRNIRSVKKSSAFGVANVGNIRDICAQHGFNKVLIVHAPNNPKNESHSEIIRLPRNDLALCDALALSAFTTLIPDSDIA